MMTREEAIERIGEQYKVCKEFYHLSANPEKDYPGVMSYMEALDLSLSALRPVSREQVVKMKKNAVSGQFEDWYGQEFTCPECGHKSLGKGNFCKNCGCPHTDEAVQMVMERVEALYENRD